MGQIASPKKASRGPRAGSRAAPIESHGAARCSQARSASYESRFCEAVPSTRCRTLITANTACPHARHARVVVSACLRSLRCGPRTPVAGQVAAKGPFRPVVEALNIEIRPLSRIRGALLTSCVICAPGRARHALFDLARRLAPGSGLLAFFWLRSPCWPAGTRSVRVGADGLLALWPASWPCWPVVLAHGGLSCWPVV